MTPLAPEWLIQRSEVSVIESDVIGEGGCACIVRGVYRARAVAVKLLHDDHLTATAVNLLEREAYIMSLVSRPRHPNIVRFVGASFGGRGTAHSNLQRSPFIVTELLDTDLRRLYEWRHLPRSSLLSIFLDVVYGLCYLHERSEPIVHCDLAPVNIFLKAVSGDAWRAKIGDFGTANLAGKSTSIGGGTPLYSAPETLPSTSADYDTHSLGITVKADVYSYGILLLEVAMGRVPESEAVCESLAKGLQSKWPSLHSLAVTCSEQRPRDRPTASQVLDKLEHIASTDRPTRSLVPQNN